MKTNLVSLIRSATLAATLLALPAFAATKNTAADRAAQQLAIKGAIPVEAAGPYVEVGTFQIQVATKLGQPATKLPDGAWLYPNFSVNESDAAGTLVVRFTNGRVSTLTLVTPAVAMAISTPAKSPTSTVVAGLK